MTSTSRQFKDAIYGQFARIGQAIGSPRRLELLDLLSQGPRTVEALARQAGQSIANTSHHLQVLRGAHLVESEKEGLYVTYRLAGAEVDAFFLSLRQLAESRLAEVERITRDFFAERGAVEAVPGGLLLERVRGGEVTVLDVRPREEFDAAHIPGAISMPLNELEARLGELPPGQDVVAYCRGPYCVLSADAVAMLKAQGFTAFRMEEGLPEWRAQGNKIVAGPHEA